jgi:endonuclease YncB( thermonuclease family)
MKLGYPINWQKRSSRILFWLFFFLSIALSQYTLAEEGTFKGVVTKVSDGDTIQVTTNNQTKITIRLSGIDCPEIAKINHKTGKISKPGQPFSQEALEYMVQLAMGKQVKIVVHGRDQYHRLLGIVFYNDRDVNLELVKKGLAEVYRGNGAI